MLHPSYAERQSGVWLHSAPPVHAAALVCPALPAVLACAVAAEALEGCATTRGARH